MENLIKCSGKRNTIYLASKEVHKEIVEFLIQKGADIPTNADYINAASKELVTKMLFEDWYTRQDDDTDLDFLAGCLQEKFTVCLGEEAGYSEI